MSRRGRRIHCWHLDRRPFGARRYSSHPCLFLQLSFFPSTRTQVILTQTFPCSFFPAFLREMCPHRGNSEPRCLANICNDAPCSMSQTEISRGRREQLSHIFFKPRQICNSRASLACPNPGTIEENSSHNTSLEMTGKKSSSAKHASTSTGAFSSGGRGKGSRRYQQPSEREEIITFRKYLNYEEANRLNRTMDENSEHLDRIEDQLRELDAKLQEKKRRHPKSSSK